MDLVGQQRPAAVLWDMDGTLVDSEPYWIAAETDLVTSYGGTWSHEDGLGLVGNALLTSARVLQGAGVDLAAETIVDRLIDQVAARVRETVPWQPGAVKLLSDLLADGIPCALVTMSYRKLAEAVVDAAPQGAFGAIVTGEEVTHGKPHPEPYLLAAARLGVKAEECVAIEDSPTGIGSARAAGARTLGVVAQVPIAAEHGLSRAASLEQVSLATLYALAKGETVDLL